jgi:pheromone a factor receptor
MCIVLPCIWIVVCKSNGFALCSNIANPSHAGYCFQSVRYIIIEDFGCSTGTWSSYASSIILFVPPMVLAVATLVYGSEQASCDNLAPTYLIYPPATAIAFCHLVKHHRITARFLTSHLAFRNAGLSSSQYYRLMAMSMATGIWGAVWNSLQLNHAIQSGIFPIPSWHELHKGDSTVMKLPLVNLSPEKLASVRLFWWRVPGGAFFFFMLFGTNREVFSEYARLWTWFSTTVLRRPLPEKEWPTSTPRFE